MFYSIYIYYFHSPFCPYLFFIFQFKSIYTFFALCFVVFWAHKFSILFFDSSEFFRLLLGESSLIKDDQGLACHSDS